MIRSNERTLGAKGTMTMPKEMRASLGLTRKTSVEFLKAKNSDEIAIIRYKKHCVTCGRVAKQIKKLNGRYICDKCIAELDNVDYINGDDSGNREVVDNLIVAKRKLELLREEIAEYESILYNNYELGEADNLGSLGAAKVRNACTVKEPTADTYQIIRDFMNKDAMSYHLDKKLEVSYVMSAKYKSIVALLKHDEYLTDGQGEKATGALDMVVKSFHLEDEQEALVWQFIDKWSDKPEINKKNLRKVMDLQEDDYVRLELAHNWFKIKEMFPKVNCSNVQQLKDALMVSDTLKISLAINEE